MPTMLPCGQRMTDTAASDAARALAARRPLVTYRCMICGDEFSARRVSEGKRAPLVCRTPRCRNKRREQTRTKPPRTVTETH